MTAGPDMTIAAAKMAAALLFGLACLFGALYLLRRWSGMGGMPSRGGMRILGTLPLGFKAYIAMIEIPGSILVVGISRNEMHLLHRISDPATVTRVLDGAAASPRNAFSNLLKRKLRETEKVTNASPRR